MADSVNKFDLECDCADKDHAIRFTHFINDEGGDDFTVNATMTHYLPWYKRLLPGIRYIIGIDNTFITHVELFIGDREKLGELVRTLTEWYRTFNDPYEETRKARRERK